MKFSGVLAVETILVLGVAVSIWLSRSWILLHLGSLVRRCLLTEANLTTSAALFSPEVIVLDGVGWGWGWGLVGDGDGCQ